MRTFYFIQWYSWYARIWKHLTHTWVRKIAVENPNTNMGHNSLPMTLGTVWTATTPAWTVTHTSNKNLQYLFRCSFVKARLPTGDKLKRKIVSFVLNCVGDYRTIYIHTCKVDTLLISHAKRFILVIIFSAEPLCSVTHLQIIIWSTLLGKTHINWLFK